MYPRRGYLRKECILNGDFWGRGQQADLAGEAGATAQDINDILHRRRGVSPQRARELEAASLTVLGFAIPWEAWLFNRTCRHPAFYGEPEGGE